MLATDLADYCVRKGVPFRKAHQISGAAVKLCEDSQRPLHSVTLAELQGLHECFEKDVTSIWDFEKV